MAVTINIMSSMMEYSTKTLGTKYLSIISKLLWDEVSHPNRHYYYACSKNCEETILDLTFCWPCNIMYHNNVTNLIQFKFHKHFITSQSSTCFGLQASIFKRRYTSRFWCELHALLAVDWLQVVGQLVYWAWGCGCRSSGLVWCGKSYYLSTGTEYLPQYYLHYQQSLTFKRAIYAQSVLLYIINPTPSTSFVYQIWTFYLADEPTFQTISGLLEQLCRIVSVFILIQLFGNTTAAIIYHLWQYQFGQCSWTPTIIKGLLSSNWSSLSAS
jgi:hypothetical protein